MNVLNFRKYIKNILSRYFRLFIRQCEVLSFIFAKIKDCRMRSRWTALFTANFFGVFNDNLLKHALIFVAVNWRMPAWLTHSQLISLVSASLVLPYLLLSPLAGRIAVLHPQKRVFLNFKLLEFPIMTLAAISFIFELILPAIIAMFLMGIQSSLYSPAKYGLIREIGGKEGSAYGSGGFEAMAFAGILVGTIVASIIADYYHVSYVVVLFAVLAIAGYFAVRFIPAELKASTKVDSSANVSINPLRFLWQSYQFCKTLPGVNRAVVGISIFWMIGAMIQMTVVLHSKYVYLNDNSQTGLIMAAAAIGIGAGTWIAGIFAKWFRSGTLMIFGLAGMLLTIGVVVFTSTTFTLFGVLIFLFALMGGFFLVPNLTHVQRAESGILSGQLMAYMNLITFVFVLFGTALFSVITLFSDENSFFVFGSIALICLITLVYLIVLSHKEKKYRII